MKIKKILKITAIVLLCILALAAFLAFFAARWYIKIYGDVGFDSILFTLTNDIAATDKGIVSSFIKQALVPAVVFATLLCVLLFFSCKKKLLTVPFKDKKICLYPFRKWFSMIVSFIISGVLIFNAAQTARLDEYIKFLMQQTAIFKNEYVDPDDVNITFPETKRNLIYIYLESMETSYTSTDLGGELSYNLIPNLYNLADENINFSHNDGVGGFNQLTGTTWTIGAMVAHTSGLPLKVLHFTSNTYGADSFLPGATSITDILHENGYYQALMVGSDASFGNRDQYFSQHGIDRIYDYYTAKEDNIIASNYRVWWGMEDKYLYEYAKVALTEISQQDKPFAFNMLTVDTHHVDGYACEYCKGDYSQQYENVISCADRQIAEFIDWIKAQDFYENTTIVITGDHFTMDNGYITRNSVDQNSRRIYNCFINSAIDTENSKNRQFATIDMFPTTLAAMGCTIEGDRLGLGTNLFSGKQTLIERLGFDYVNEEVAKSSDFYVSNFSLG